MPKICPLKTSPEWKALEAKYGEHGAHEIWIKNKHTIPKVLADNDFVYAFSEGDKAILTKDAGIIDGLDAAARIAAVTNMYNRFIEDTIREGQAKSSTIFEKYQNKLKKKIISIDKLKVTIDKAIETLMAKKKLSKKDEVELADLNENAVRASQYRARILPLLNDANEQSTSVILADAKSKLSVLENFKLIDSEGNVTEISNNEEEDLAVENTKVWENDFVFKIDSRKTMSRTIRLFLAKIPLISREQFVKDEDGEFILDEDGNRKIELIKKKDFLDGTLYVDFNTAFQQLHEVLSDIPNTDWDSYIDALKKYSKEVGNENFNNLWVKSLIEALTDKRTTANDQASFIAEMYKIKLDMQVVAWRRLPMFDENGVFQNMYTFKTSVENANLNSLSISNQLKWSDNLKQGHLMDYDDDIDDFKYNITKEELKQIQDEYVELKRLAKDQVGNKILLTNKLIKFLEFYGIELTVGAATDIVTKKKLYGEDGTITTFDNFINSSLGYYIKNTEAVYSRIKNGEVVYFNTENLIGTSTTKLLAKFNAKYTPELFSNSFNFGSKTVYGFTYPNYAMNKKNRLLSNKGGILDDLSKSVYSSPSYYVEHLANKTSHLRGVFNIRDFPLSPLRQVGKKPRPKGMDKFSEAEYELHADALFFRSTVYKKQTDSGFAERIASFIFPTSSDKARGLIVDGIAFEVQFNKEDRVAEEQIDFIIDRVVASEWERIYKMKESTYNPGDRLFFFFPEMNDKKVTVKDENGNATFTDTFNGLALSSPKITENIKVELRKVIQTRLLHETKAKMAFWKANNIGVERKIGNASIDFDFLSGEAFDATHASILRQGNKVSPKLKNMVKYVMAMNLVYNHLFTTANMFQVIIGDQAQYYKELSKEDFDTLSRLKKESLVRKLENPTQEEINAVSGALTKDEINRANYKQTLDNLGKRMAMVIAPGSGTSNHIWEREFGTTDYLQVYANDFFKTSSKETMALLERVKATGIEEYKDIDVTDAQEYSTWREHLTGLLADGSISDKEFKRVKRKLKNGEKLDTDFSVLEASFQNEEIDEDTFKKEGDKLKINAKLTGSDLKIALKPRKPVYSGSKFITKNGHRVERIIYIKSSSIPLLPHLTSGFEIDKIRMYMETLENDKGLPVRFTYKSAVKVGFYGTKGSKVFDTDGTVTDIVGHDLDGKGGFDKLTEGTNVTYETLFRDDFRIQMNIPFDREKGSVNSGSQSDKLLFDGLRDVANFKVDGVDGTFTGEELQEMFKSTLREIFENKYRQISEVFGNNSTIKTTKIRDMLMTELKRTSVPTKSERDGLRIEDGEFVTPLWLSPHSQRYSALLNSIIYNNAVKRKRNGQSSVLVSEAGFKLLEEAGTKIVLTDSYKGGELLPMRVDPVTGKMLPAQLIINFKMIDHNNNSLYLKHYLEKDKDGNPTNKLDTTKLPKELLEGFGFRIPSESHSSMTYFEIVGFIDDTHGDMVIAPKELVAQMGSDFDVDKLYSYTYNVYRNAKTKVLSKFGKGIDVNQYGKYYEQHLQNQLLDIQLAVMKNPDPVVVNAIMSSVGYGNLPYYKDLFLSMQEESVLPDTYLSSEFNRKKYTVGKVGKVGTSFFASANMLNATLQNEDVYMYQKDKEDNISREWLVFGNQYNNWDGDLSEAFSLKKDSPLSKAKTHTAFLGSSVDNENEQLLGALNITPENFKMVGFLTQAGYQDDIIIPFLQQPIIIDYLNKIKQNESIFNQKKLDNTQLSNEVLHDYRTVNETTEEKEDFSVEIDRDLANFKNDDASLRMVDLVRNQDQDMWKEYQRSLLYKFLKVERLSNTYNKIMVLGNVDSKGMGKNLEEAMLKKSKIEEALTSKIINLEEAFENSISGMAYNQYLKVLPFFSEYSLATNPDSHFEKFLNQYNKATGKSMDKLFADEYNDVINGIKAYTLALHSDRREELLHGDESIYKLIKKIEHTEYFKTNDFLKRIKTRVQQKNRGYDAVIFDASLSNEFIDGEIYKALIDIMNYDGDISGVNISELGHKLAEYAILDGARFSPQTFSKYVPMYMFDKLALNHRGKNFDLTDNAQYAIEQIIQHNPTSSSKIDRKNGRFKRISKANEVGEYSYTDSNDKSPAYIWSYHKGDKVLLYKLSERGFYNRIDVLGDKGTLNEYSYQGLTTARSTILANRAPTATANLPLAGTQDGKTTLDEQIEDSISTKILFGDDEAFIVDKSVPLTAEWNDQYTVLSSIDLPLARAFSEIFSEYLSTKKIKLVPGGQNWDAKSTKDLNIEVSNDFYNENEGIEVDETIVHEHIHTLNRDVIANPQKYGDAAVALVKELEDKYKITLLNSINLDGGDFVRGLVSAFINKDRTIVEMKYVFDLINEGNEMPAEVTEFINDLKDKNVNITAKYDTIFLRDATVEDDVEHNYYLSGIQEFGAGMASETFRAYVDEINKDVTFVSRIKDAFLAFYRALGFSSTFSTEIVDIIFNLAAIQTKVDIETSLTETTTSMIGLGSSVGNTFLPNDKGELANSDGYVLSEAQESSLTNLEEMMRTSDASEFQMIYIRDDIYVIDPNGVLNDSYGNTFDNLEYRDAPALSFKAENANTMDIIEKWYSKNSIFNLDDGSDKIMLNGEEYGVNINEGTIEYMNIKTGKSIRMGRLYYTLLKEKQKNGLIEVGVDNFIFSYDDTLIADIYGNLYDSTHKDYINYRDKLDGFKDSLFSKTLNVSRELTGDEINDILKKHKLYDNRLDRVKYMYSYGSAIKAAQAVNTSLPSNYAAIVEPRYKEGNKHQYSVVVISKRVSKSDSRNYDTNLYSKKVFAEPNGRDVLKELTQSEAEYILELAALGIIEINC